MKPPSVLFLNRVYPPDRGASGWRLQDLVVRLEGLGWKVACVTDPQPMASDPQENQCLSKNYSASLRRIRKQSWNLPPSDVVVSLSDPPFLVALGQLLARRWGAACVHWCHDLYPDLLPVVGDPRLAMLVPGMRALMRPILAACQQVVVGGHCMARYLEQVWRLPMAQIRVFPLWPDPLIAAASIKGEAHPGADAEGLWPEGTALTATRPVVAYVGNFGLAHPFSGVLEAAARLDAGPDSPLFLLAGEGRQKAAIMAEVAARRIRNVHFLPWQPESRLPALMARADVHLALMKPQAVGQLIPSKVAGILAAGRPCLFLGPEACWAAELARQAGEVMPPDDGRRIADSLRRWLADPHARQACGMRGRQCAPWDADSAARSFSGLLHEARARRSARWSPVAGKLPAFPVREFPDA